MIVSAHQPYFCPYPGFFSKPVHSDVFVLLDSVQFPRGGTWITRNRFKNDRGAFWMSVPVWKKGKGLQRIDEVGICPEGRWKKKHLESIRCAYADAPYLEQHLPLFERVFSDAYEKISNMNHDIISYAMDSLGIPARLLRLSETDASGAGAELLVSLCRSLEADGFLAFRSAWKYLDEGLFRRAGIETLAVDPPELVYPQLWGDFVPNLSVFDLLLTCGPKSREILERGRQRVRCAGL